MSTENVRIVRAYLDTVWNRGDTGDAATLVAEDLVQHNPQLPDGREALLSYVAALRTRMPDLRFEVARTIADGDLVVAHSLLTGGGGALAMAVIDIYRIADGRIAEHWDAAQPVPEHTASGHPII